MAAQPDGRGADRPGVVDERSIEDVRPDELRGFTQCHFFAGIGVWSYALRRAGWPDDRPVWTGSCPCQPFSSAGKGSGFADERHLWPAFHHLIRECRPAVVLGEQVASKDADPWVDLVQTDLEALDYAFGALAFPSAGIGAPHVRDRLYWVADAQGERWERGQAAAGAAGWNGIEAGRLVDRLADADGGRLAAARASGPGLQDAQQCGCADRLADAPGGGRHQECADGGRGAGGDRPQGHATGPLPGGAGCGMADADRGQFHGLAVVGGIEHDRQDGGRAQGGCQPEPCGHVRGLADADGPGGPAGLPAAGHGEEGHAGVADHRGGQFGGGEGSLAAARPGPANGFWRDADWLACRDGKWRPVEPGTFPLAHGAPARVGRLRAYGNAINAEAATEMIRAFQLARGELLIQGDLLAA